jgi:hypothetical protein
MTRLAIVSALGGLVLAANVHAQAPAPVEKPADPPKVAAPTPAKPPVFTDGDKAAIDALAVQSQRDEALKELHKLQADVRERELRARIEALRQYFRRTYPGFDWDVVKGALVPLPPPKVAAKP